jgi:hypothetical protein
MAAFSLKNLPYNLYRGIEGGLGEIKQFIMGADPRAADIAMNQDEANRRAIHAEPIDFPNEPVFMPINVDDIDLFEVFSARMRDVRPHGIPFNRIINAGILYQNSKLYPTWFQFDVLNRIPKEQLFLCFIYILLGCDMAHDFTKDVVRKNLNLPVYKLQIAPDYFNSNVDAVFNYILNTNINRVINAIKEAHSASNDIPLVSTWQTLLGYCVCVINLEIETNNSCGNPFVLQSNNISPGVYGTNMLTAFFKSDSNAKDVVSAISRLLGIYLVDFEAVIPDGSSLQVVNSLTPPPGYFREWNKVQVRIDATSATINNIADFSNLAKKGTKDKQVLIMDSATANDPAGVGSLEKAFRHFRKVSRQYDQKNINAYVSIGGTRVNILTANLKPVGFPPGLPPNWVKMNQVPPPQINIRVSQFLTRSMTWHQITPNQNSITSVMKNILDRWFTYPLPVNLNPVNTTDFMDIIAGYTMEKTLGDFIQIITYAATPKPKAFISFDTIACTIAGILGSTAILDDGTRDDRFVFRRLFITNSYAQHNRIPIANWCGIAVDRRMGVYAFGKTNVNFSKRLKFISNLELKNKLKSVGIKITKNVRGKRKYLSRKELENKARLFNNLQNTAKEMKIKIMYKSKSGIYKYKMYKRLQKEMNIKLKMKYKSKNRIINRSNFG